jgi:hypothetical protein
MSAIEPGDLVVVVHVHCEKASRQLGQIRRVEKVEPARLGRCPRCGARDIGPFVPLVARGLNYPLPWVRKIEPLSKKDVIEEIREMTKSTVTRWKNTV